MSHCLKLCLNKSNKPVSSHQSTYCHFVALLPFQRALNKYMYILRDIYSTEIIWRGRNAFQFLFCIQLHTLKPVMNFNIKCRLVLSETFKPWVYNQAFTRSLFIAMQDAPCIVQTDTVSNIPYFISCVWHWIAPQRYCRYFSRISHWVPTAIRYLEIQ